MQPFSVKFAACFKAAEGVVRCYWEHLAPTGGRRVSLENLQRAVEIVAGVKIEKQQVFGAGGEFVRGNIERYPDRVLISVRAEQDEKWKRFTVAKELSHVAIDAEPSDYCADAVQIIKEIVKATDFDFDLSASSDELKSEKLAEMIALELVYPLEFRRGDREAVDANATSYAALSDEFMIPRTMIERALAPRYIAACEIMWKLIGLDDIKALIESARKR